METSLTHTPQSAPAGSILQPDEDFQIRKIKAYSTTYNVTYRSPRKIDNQITHQVSTTTIDVSNLKGLRVEEIDGESFVISDKKGYDEPVRMKVDNTDIANQIIKSLVIESAEKEVHLLKYVPEKYVRLNHVISSTYPSILTIAGVIFLISASFRLLIGN